jgi:hypothetical protein
VGQVEGRWHGNVGWSMGTGSVRTRIVALSRSVESAFVITRRAGRCSPLPRLFSRCNFSIC